MYNVITVNIWLFMTYHHGNLREELILSACKICEANGHQQMSLRSIAKDANVSQTAPYRHFKTKESLLAEVSKLGFTELTDRLNLSVSSHKKLSDTDRFLEMGLAYIEFGLEKRKIYDLMHSPSIRKGDFPDLLKAAAGAFDVLIKIVTDLNPGISEDKISQICMKHWAMMHGLIGLMDIKIDPRIESKVGDAMIQIKNDLRTFLIESVDF